MPLRNWSIRTFKVAIIALIAMIVSALVVGLLLLTDQSMKTIDTALYVTAIFFDFMLIAICVSGLLYAVGYIIFWWACIACWADKSRARRRKAKAVKGQQVRRRNTLMT